MPKVWIYETGPIDEWFGFIDLQIDFSKLKGFEVEGNFDDMRKIISWAIQLLLTSSSWEGDHRASEGGWKLSGLPDPHTCQSRLLLGCKQDNNGQCFFISPFELPWLEDGKCLELNECPL